jgi:regulator of protease activity HflC (stomatin/prohibitin superfamily)
MVDQAEAPPEAPPAGGQPQASAPYQQLTQARVPLSEAAEAFETPDSAGRLPIVLLAGARSAVVREAILIGLILVGAGLILDLEATVRTALLAGGGVLIFLAVFRSFIVRVPEGARALLIRSGRYHRTLGPGIFVMPPWRPISHLVTVREIPFEVPAAEVPTEDGVRTDVDILFTFAIEQPERFVFSISAQDFDQVCQATSLEALRRMIRGIRSEAILDLAGAESEQLRDWIAAGLEGYGVQVRRVVLTHVRPPHEYLASIEGRRIAVVQRAEEEERLALEQHRQAGRDALDRQRVDAHREIVELEARNEELRLGRLEARLGAYPEAARWDFESDRLAVARALAGNNRAVLHVGDPARVTDALVFPELDQAGTVAHQPAPALSGSVAGGANAGS